MKSKKNKELKQQKKEKKQALRTKKKVATTLSWSEICEIRDKKIILNKGKKTAFVKGVKLTPINIFIKPVQQQVQIINSLRIILNQLSMPIYWGFVFTPVDIDMYFTKLQEEIRMEEDPVIRSMMQSDFEKGCWFCDTHREISFEFILQANNEKDLFKQYDQLVQEFRSNGFRLREMDDQDYEDYIAYLYENDMINDFYFSRGIFSCLSDDDYTPSDAIEYDPYWEFNLEEQEVDENEVRQLQASKKI